MSLLLTVINYISVISIFVKMKQNYPKYSTVPGIKLINFNRNAISQKESEISALVEKIKSTSNWRYIYARYLSDWNA